MDDKGITGLRRGGNASDRPATRDAQHPESGVLNSYDYFIFSRGGKAPDAV